MIALQTWVEKEDRYAQVPWDKRKFSVIGNGFDVSRESEVKPGTMIAATVVRLEMSNQDASDLLTMLQAWFPKPEQIPIDHPTLQHTHDCGCHP